MGIIAPSPSRLPAFAVQSLILRSLRFLLFNPEPMNQQERVPVNLVFFPSARRSCRGTN